ncbi:hypothetical protein N9L68_07540 [bacterium]|nr:hypothetical protein [bacterium]
MWQKSAWLDLQSDVAHASPPLMGVAKTKADRAVLTVGHSRESTPVDYLVSVRTS